jgi:nitrogen fixation NifU-like protein
MDLYSEIILDYYKNPRNKSIPSPITHSATEHNPSCGDKITFYLNVDGAGRIQSCGYQGEGCAISQAATSMLTELLENKSISEAQNLTSQDILEMLA